MVYDLKRTVMGDLLTMALILYTDIENGWLSRSSRRRIGSYFIILNEAKKTHY
jgi:hypothetical protein